MSTEEIAMREIDEIKPGAVVQNERPMKFHVGYYDFHGDISLNFQMNRWVAYLGAGGLEDMKAIAPKIKNYTDWKREFIALGERALSEGRPINAAYYFRSAEFFTFAGSPDKKELRDRFLKLMIEGYGLSGLKKYLIPYTNGSEQGYLPAYRLTPENPKGTLVVFGGFDSYIEEGFPIIRYMADKGFDVVCFDGPGQGGALEDYGLHMTHAWEKPVGSVLDYFRLDNVTLIGISLGGYLAIRAAAFEPRVRRVIAFDIMYDFLDANLKSLNSIGKSMVRSALAMGLSMPVNLLLARKAKKRYLVEWVVKQGMHVTGTNTPFDYMRTVKKYSTKNVSAMVKQDVLLLAGSEDHYVPVEQLYRQGRALTGARSLTMRLFTKAEHAQNHCQVGNMGLAVDTILAWIELQQKHG